MDNQGIDLIDGSFKANNTDDEKYVTLPKFSRVVARILLATLKCMMKKQPPVLSPSGRMVFLTEHVMKPRSFSVRKIRQLRADDEIEYMISEDGSSIIHLESHVQDYIDRTFVSSHTPEGERPKRLSGESMKNFDTN